MKTNEQIPSAFLALLVAVHVLAAVVLLRDPGVKTVEYEATSDAGRYHEIADSSGTPYRDFDVEYPPLAIAVTNTLDTGDFGATLDRIVVVQLLADLAIAALLLWQWGRRAAVSYLLVAAPILATVLTKIDLLSVLLAVVAVVLVQRSRDAAGGVAFAGAVFVKLWPLVLTPWLIVTRRWRAAAWAVAGGVVGLAAWVSLGDIDGPRQVATFRGARGWHVESLPGQFVDVVRGGSVVFESGSWRVGAPPSWLGMGLLALALGIVLWVWVRSGDRDDIGLPSVTAVATLMVFATLLSPQFMIWLVPWAAIAGAAGERRVEVLVASAVLLTVVLQALFEAQDSHTGPALVGYGLRNLLLIAVVSVGIVRLRAPVRPGPSVDAEREEA
ncbi:MAG: glycosyltransferase 87 family protein [Acidimicrobiia bacterium]